MIKKFPKEIDPERLERKLDLLATAIWQAAEDEVAKELETKEHDHKVRIADIEKGEGKSGKGP